MRKVLLLILVLLTFISGIKAQWSKCSLPTGIYPFSLAVSGSNVYLGTLSNGMYLSTDKGASWKEINNGITIKQIWSVSVVDNVLFAGTNNGGLFRSTNNGDSWTASNSGISSTTIIRSVVKFNNKLFATSTNQGIYISADNGGSWTQHNDGLTGLVAAPLLVAENELFAGVLQKVYKYDATNAKWVAASSGIINNTISALVCLKDQAGTKNVFAGVSNSGSNVFRTVNSGINWTAAYNGMPAVPVGSLAAVGTILFAGNDYGVNISKDFGNTWTDCNSGFEAASYGQFLSVGSGELYVLQRAGLWKRSLAEFGITASASLAQLPERTLSNLSVYPNPVSALTEICYQLSKKALVSLSVYNLAGNCMQTLFTQEQDCGNYSFSYAAAANQLSPGIYLVRLTAGRETQTKKLIVVP